MGVLLIVSLLLEVGVLLYLELKAWNTVFTPLNCLMLPYVIILMVTLAVAGGELGFVDFCYPSVLLWNIGLMVFALPSLLMAYAMHKGGRPLNAVIGDREMSGFITVLCILLSLLFLWHLKGTLSMSAEALGSDEFGEEFSGYGVWGHLRILSIPLLMLSIYFVDRRHWWLWLFIVVFLTVSMLNQVKGWAIIPCLAALAMRVYAGRTHLTWRLGLWIVVGAFAVFFGSYALSILVVQDRGVSNDFMEFIFSHFFHYLTSGTLGWSMDVEQGLPDYNGQRFEWVIAQIVNLSRTFTGQEVVSPINPLYFNTGTALTNVRTLFGTVYINAGLLPSFLYVLFLSTFMYALKLMTVKFPNVFVFTAYFFNLALLFFGWFDLYFAALTAIEVPVLTLLLLPANRVLRMPSLIRKTT